jgi:hypothetical protein
LRSTGFRAYFEQRYDGVVLHGEIRIHALELGKLGLQLLRAFEVGDTQPSVFALPVVIGGQADAVLAANLFHLHPCFCLPEDRHDLALLESALFHRFVCFVVARNSNYDLFRIRGL